MSDALTFIILGWKNIWQQKAIWLFSSLPILSQLFPVFQSKLEPSSLLSLLDLVESFISIILWLASVTGVSYLAYCFSIGELATVSETISAIKKFSGRVFRFSCLGFLIIVPCLLFAITTSTRNPNFPANLSINLILATLPLSLFTAVWYFSIIEFFANDLGIWKSIKKAWILHTDHFKILASIGIILTGTFQIIIAVAGGLAVLIQSGFDTTSLSNLNFINPYASLSHNILFLLLSAAIQIIWSPFIASVFTLAYLKFSSAKIHS
jgi:hypothetical protein